MNKKRYIVIALMAIAIGAWGYNEHHGPFPDDAEVELVNLVELKHAPHEARPYPPRYIFSILWQKDSRLEVLKKSDMWCVELILGGKTALQQTPISSYDMHIGIMAQSADLNQDGIDDFVIYSPAGGCGLASGYYNIAFVLSSEESYTLTTVLTLFPDKTDFILLNGKAYFIHTSFQYGDICKDGKYHNFWIYNLLAFGKNGVVVDNSAHAAFPKTIWYTFKPNHKETSIITDEQKAELRKRSLTDIFWNEEKDRQ